MSRDEVVEALETERYGSQWAARERQRVAESRRLLATLEEHERVELEKSA